LTKARTGDWQQSGRQLKAWRMTEEIAHRPALWRSAGQAWVKRLARTTVGNKVLRAAYEGYFESASGHQRLFRGLYRDFASAAADAPPGKQVGYDGDAAATRHAHTRHFLIPSDYPVLFWLTRLLLPKTRLLFDLGGNVGNRYLAFRKYLTYPENLTWLVNDIPAVVALGRTIAEQEAAVHLQFTTDYARLGEADILLASGVLQVLEDWNGFLLAPNLPRHLLINRTPVGDQPNAVTLHSIGVSFVPYHIFNRRSFVAKFNNLGYRLVDEWRTPELGCWIPDHASHSLDSYSGFYFVLDSPGPPRADR
jgi:putative methyltransferase (TIGR04325 family)